MNSKLKWRLVNIRETASNNGHMITVVTDVTERKKEINAVAAFECNRLYSFPCDVLG